MITEGRGDITGYLGGERRAPTLPREEAATGDYRSLLVSHNRGTIRNSFTDMDSVGAGGLVGGSAPGSLIQNCYTRGDLTVEATLTGVLDRGIFGAASIADNRTSFRTTHGGLITAFLGGRMENVYTTGDIRERGGRLDDREVSNLVGTDYIQNRRRAGAGLLTDFEEFDEITGEMAGSNFFTSSLDARSDRNDMVIDGLGGSLNCGGAVCERTQAAPADFFELAKELTSLHTGTKR